jgi:photosystem II stability/assembly factor-like uncharacterized protein
MKMLTRLVGAASACAVLAAGASAAPGKTYVLWLGARVFVTADAHSWRNVTPRGAVVPGTTRAIDGVQFRGRQGWLLSSDCVSGKGMLYRTDDEGRTWRTYPFHAHSCAGGANFYLDVLNARRAWVVQNEPTAPLARIYRTTDGGRSWHVVRELADYGKVAFVSPAKGWLAGVHLLRTSDGGRTWHVESLPAPRGYRGRLALLSAPHFFGRTGVLAGQYEGAKPMIGFYRTSDGGSHWRLLGTEPGSSPGIFPQFTLTAVSASVAWLLTDGDKPFAYVTRDGGRHWAAHALPTRLYAPVVVSARVAAASDFHGRPFVTRDGGRTWRPLKL